MEVRENILNYGINEKEKQIIESFKSLPEDFWNFKDCEASDSIHGIHSYPATMIYPISQNILNIMKKHTEIQSILDPFEGSGTVLVEGIKAGISDIYGNDLNPLANLISKVKTTKINTKEFEIKKQELILRINNLYQDYNDELQQIEDYLIIKKGCNDFAEKNGWGDSAYEYVQEYLALNKKSIDFPNFKNIGYWFKPKVLLELGLIKKAILGEPDKDIRDIFLLSFSEVVRKVSNRRNGEFKMYRIPPEKVVSFSPDTKKEFLNTLNRNNEKIEAFNDDIYKRKFSMHLSKENAMDMKSVPNDSIDIVITSPPYGDSRTTVAYGEFSKVSLSWLGLEECNEEIVRSLDKNLMGGKNVKIDKTFKCEVNSKTLNLVLQSIIEKDAHRAGDVYSFYYDLEKTIKEISKKVKKGGFQFWVVGNRIVKEEKLNTDVIIAEIAQQYDLKHLLTFERNISNKTMPLKNSPTNEAGKSISTMNKEYIIVLEKI